MFKRLRNRFKKQHPTRGPGWWKKDKRPGVRVLAYIFKLDRADLIRAARPYKNKQSRATAKRHVHKHRPAGSKMLKKYNRAAWELKYGQADI